MCIAVLSSLSCMQQLPVRGLVHPSEEITVRESPCENPVKIMGLQYKLEMSYRLQPGRQPGGDLFG